MREWLDSQAAGGILVYDDGADTYMLPAEHAMALANDESPVFVARAMNAFGSLFIDFHAPSIETARQRVDEAGFTDRTSFQVAKATEYDGTYDLICFFDCLLVEPFAFDDHSHNMADNPMAPLLYMASAGICVPNSLSQDVGLGLGAQAGEARLRDVFEQAGFTQFRLAAETPMNLIIEARP